MQCHSWKRVNETVFVTLSQDWTKIHNAKWHHKLQPEERRAPRDHGAFQRTDECMHAVYLSHGGLIALDLRVVVSRDLYIAQQ